MKCQTCQQEAKSKTSTGTRKLYCSMSQKHGELTYDSNHKHSSINDSEIN